MMRVLDRLRWAAPIFLLHLAMSLAVAALVAALVFGVWFPHPFHAMTGAAALFAWIVSVDVVCGPLLTAVLMSPLKSRRELLMDLSVVALVQLAALSYGLWTVWQVRPVYMVHELDRFKVIDRAALQGASLEGLPPPLAPGIWKPPMLLGLRPPHDQAEREKVMFESIQGGRDYAERPEFYRPYDDAAATQALQRAQPLERFLRRHPTQRAAAFDLLAQAQGAGLSAAAAGSDAPSALAAARYVPVRARQDWIAVLTPKGHVAGYLPGDGF